MALEDKKPSQSINTWIIYPLIIFVFLILISIAALTIDDQRKLVIAICTLSGLSMLFLLFTFFHQYKKIVSLFSEIKKDEENIREICGFSKDELRRRLVRFQGISYYANDGVATVNGAGKITYVNEAIQKMLDYTEEEMIGMRFSRFTDFSGFKKELTTLMIRRFGKTGKGPLVGQTVEMPMIKKNGEKITGEVSFSGVQVETGRWEAVVFIRDITKRKEQEVKLIKEQNKAEQYFEVAPLMMLVLDEDGNIQRINEAGAQILKLKKSEAIGKNWFDNFIPENLRGEIKRVFREVYDVVESRYEIYENPIVNNLGEERMIMWSNSKILDEDGKVAAVLSVGRDVTELKEAREQVVQSEKEYSDLYNNSPAVFFSVDPKTSHIIRINDTYLHKTGFTREEVIGQPVFFVYHSESTTAAKAAFEQFVKTGEVKNADLILRKKDGGKIFVQLNVSAVKDEKGEIKYSRSVLIDVTELKKAREETLKIARLPEVNPFMVLQVGLDGKITYMNPAARAKQKAGLVITTGGDVLNDVIWQQVKNEVTAEATDIHLDVGEYTLEITMVRDADRIIMFMRDKTDQMKTERKIRDLDQLKSRFITALSHVARTPLSEVRWAIESLVSGEFGELNEGQKTLMQKAFASEQEVLSVIDKINFVLDIERETMTLSKTPISFSSLVRSIFLQTDTECKVKGLSCTITESSKERKKVNVDPDKIRIALEVLFNNAVYYTKEGKIRVKYSIVNDILTVKILDTGIGIPASEQFNITERFFRASNAQSMHPNGLGVGLYVAKSIVQKHGGSLDFKSVEGKGSEFWIKLPINTD